MNCCSPSVARGALGEITRAFRTTSVKPPTLIAYTNSGEAWDAEAREWVSPSPSEASDFASTAVALAKDFNLGMVGGCCRVGPEDIRLLRSRLEEESRAADVHLRRV